MHQPYSETTIIVCLKYTYNYINIHKEWCGSYVLFAQESEGSQIFMSSKPT